MLQVGRFNTAGPTRALTSRPEILSFRHIAELVQKHDGQTHETVLITILPPFGVYAIQLETGSHRRGLSMMRRDGPVTDVYPIWGGGNLVQPAVS